MNIRIFDNGLEGDKLQDVITAIAGTWGSTELDNNDEDIAIGNIIVGFRYNYSGSLAGYPYNLPDGSEGWHTTMAFISYDDGTSAIKTFTDELMITSTASMIILITRNLT
jgi:hypothetical protein